MISVSYEAAGCDNASGDSDSSLPSRLDITQPTEIARKRQVRQMRRVLRGIFLRDRDGELAGWYRNWLIACKPI